MEMRNETLIVKGGYLQKGANNAKTKSLKIRLTEKEYDKFIKEAKEFDISRESIRNYLTNNTFQTL